MFALQNGAKAIISLPGIQASEVSHPESGICRERNCKRNRGMRDAPPVDEGLDENI